MRIPLLLLSFLLALSACMPRKEGDPNTAPPDAAHNSRNALD